MPGCDPLPGTRVVARPPAIDALAEAHTRAMRFAPDDLFLPGLRPDQVTVDDVHAIVEPESGFSAAWFSPAQFDEQVAPSIEWPLPHHRPALTQGLVAGVPCKLHLTVDGVTLVTNTAHVRDLEARLG